MDLLNKYGINPANLNENVDDVAQKLALIFAKKADKETISEESKLRKCFFYRITRWWYFSSLFI